MFGKWHFNENLFSYEMDGWMVCVQVGFFFFIFLFQLDFIRTYVCTHAHPTIIHVSIRSFSSASLRHAVFPMVQFCSTFKLNNNKNNRRHFNVFFFSSFFLCFFLSRALQQKVEKSAEQAMKLSAFRIIQR